MTKVLLFGLGPDELGVDVMRVAEILNPRGVRGVPGLPEFISGVMDVRGRLVPVVDMRLRLGVDKRPVRERAIVVRTAIGRIALLVDKVIGIVTMDESKLENPPLVFRGLKREYISSLYNRGGEMMIVLDAERILTADEKIALETAAMKMRATEG